MRYYILPILLTALLINKAEQNPVLAASQKNDTIVINEILASSHSFSLDPDYSQFADWIEIYNSGNFTADLGGSYLTDDLSEPEKWQIPNGTLLPANGYLLIWADGMNESGEGLHTNFKLSNNGESVGLYAADGTVIDTLTFGKQVTDVSLGRDMNNPVKFLYFAQPTPATANTTPGFAQKNISVNVHIPSQSGFYSGPQSISMAAAEYSIIRYTTDGSTPTSSSPEYTSPLSFTTSTVLRARAYDPDRLPGLVETRTYFINEQTTLPTFSLAVDPDYLWDQETGIYVNENIASRKSWERPAVIEFFETDKHLAFSEQTSIRLFGRTAIYIPQKSLSIFLENRLDYPLFNDTEVRQFESFLLRSSSDDWHLTMFRDGFIQKMIRDNMTVDTQAYRPAVLFINGEYWGIHNIREKYNESYIETHHGVDPNNIDLLYIDERAFDIEVLAGDLVHYNTMVEFSENNDLSVQANYDIIAGMVDIDNMIDYVIAEAYIGNNSWAHNIRAWRPRTTDGKWQWLTFDLDRGFRTASYNSLAEMADRFHPFHSLLDNVSFREKFIQRFVEYINGSFKPEKVTALLDSLQEGIRNEMPNHIERWRDYCGNNVCGIPSMDQWENAVSSMRSIVQSRPATVQNQLMNLFHFDSMVQLDIQVQQPDYGNVKLGQQTIITDTYSGQFFRDMTVLLNAEANKGFQFAGWRQTSESTTILLNTGAVWKYFDDGSSPGTGWNEIDFNDSAWPSGPAQLGYGDDDENTVVDFGPDSNQKYTTTYFRTTFHMTDISHVRSLTFKLLRDDGAVVYLNGNEVLRANMPGGSIQYNTPAAASVGGSDEDTFFEYTVDTNALLNGKNTVAVEVHQYNGSSSDISFDLEIEALTTGNSDDVISENPELIINLSENQALTALFSLDFENELPVQINQDIILTAANSPYIALQDIVVLPNVTLSMSQGAEIQFSEGASFVINGRLVANGTADEPVIFEGIGNSRWGALCFENTTGPSLLSHVHIRGATTGEDAVRFKAAVSSWNSDITLDYIEMTKVNQPLYGNGGTILLTRSTLDGTDSGDDIANIQYASARVENCHLIGNGELDFDSVDDGIIRNNRIDIISTNSNRDGIDIGASDRVLIENNRIFDCPDKGISVGEGSEGTVIIGNLIVNTSMGVAVKDGSYAKIDHNTFFNDSVGVACYEKVAGQGGGNATVTNSIFSGSYNAEYSLDPKSTIEITYSLSEKNQIQGTGNLSGAAYFINALSGNFYLTPDSPCIDTGDPSAPTDPDGSRTDIGSYFYNKGPIKTTYLVINEFMADNTKTLADEAGQFDDWIEIYNGSDEPINVAGLYLTDDFSHPTLWRIPDYAPELTTIAAGGYLLVWADKDLDQGFLHADLKLSASGEQLALVKKSEDQIFFVDSLAYSTQRADVSRGRFNDGAVKWIDFAVPTPGQANDSARIDNSQNENEIPAKFAVFQNFPNPFNPSTTIGYDLPIAAYVKIEVFNSLGQRISVLKQEHKEAGAHRVEWRGMDDAGHQVSSGIYFYKVTAEEFSAVGKMVLMK